MSAHQQRSTASILQPEHTIDPPVEHSAIGPDFPDEWYGWPLGIEVSFQLWAGTGVCRELYQEYSAETYVLAVARLDTRH